jgi:hypothetical protein
MPEPCDMMGRKMKAPVIHGQRPGPERMSHKAMEAGTDGCRAGQ